MRNTLLLCRLPVGIVGRAFRAIFLVLNYFFESIKSHARANFEGSRNDQEQHSNKIIDTYKRKDNGENQNVWNAEK
jgi:hypothetical protein